MPADNSHAATSLTILRRRRLCSLRDLPGANRARRKPLAAIEVQVREVKVLRVYHAGRDSSHRARERALAAEGAEITLVVPKAWEPKEPELEAEPAVELVELDVTRPATLTAIGTKTPRRHRGLFKLSSPICSTSMKSPSASPRANG